MLIKRTVLQDGLLKVLKYRVATLSVRAPLFPVFIRFFEIKKLKILSETLFTNLSLSMVDFLQCPVDPSH
jgi:hypothetical protein